MFDNITAEAFEAYTGTTAPKNFERLKGIAIATISVYNIDNPTEECAVILAHAIFEQILFLAENERIMLINQTITSKRAGNVSVSYSEKKNTTLSPLSLQLLSQSPCNFMYRGINKCGKSC